MWHLSSFNHSLARLYRFRDEKMERAYQADINNWCLYNTQVQYIGALLVSAQGALSYFSGSQFGGGFYVNVAITFISAFCSIADLASPFVKRHRIFFNLLFNVAYLSALVVDCFYDPVLWTKLQCSSFIPDGYQLVLEGSNGVRTVKDDAFCGLIWYLMAQLQYRNIFIIALAAQFHLTLNGLCLWTVLGNSLVFLTCVAVNSVMVPQSASNIALSAVNGFILLLLFISMSMLLERMQRQKFLAQTLLERQMHSAVTADNILNHMLKNTLADAAAYIELFLAGSVPTEALKDSVLCLRRGMKACKERQLYLKLVAGEYTPVLNTVNLPEFRGQLVAGRAVRGESADLTVLFDSALITLVLDNALSNAVKHGRPEDPDVAFVIHQLGDVVSSSGLQIEFLVTNAADPSRPPLTAETVARILAGDRRALAAGRKAVLSDGIGLSHSLMAAEVGGFTMSLQQEADRVVFRLVITTQEATDTEAAARTTNSPLCAATRLAPPEPHSVGGLPRNLRFFVLDDTAASRKILEHQILTHIPTARVTAFGATESDIDLFVARAVEEADIVIVDQHLEYSFSYLGTNALKRLLLLGFRGLMCVRSGDDSIEDRKHYAACGAHCFMGKDLNGTEMMESLTAAFLGFQGGSPTSTISLGASCESLTAAS